MEVKDIGSLIYDKWYDVFVKSKDYGFEKRIIGKIQNFASEKIVLFNDRKKEVYIVSYRDIVAMLPCKTTINDTTINNTNEQKVEQEFDCRFVPTDKQINDIDGANLITTITYQGETEKDLSDKIKRNMLANRLIQIYVPKDMNSLFRWSILHNQICFEYYNGIKVIYE